MVFYIAYDTDLSKAKFIICHVLGDNCMATNLEKNETVILLYYLLFLKVLTSFLIFKWANKEKIRYLMCILRQTTLFCVSSAFNNQLVMPSYFLLQLLSGI